MSTYTVGQRIWRWDRISGPRNKRAAVIVTVHEGSVSSKSRADSEGRPTVHRITRAGLSMASKMSAEDAARAQDLEAWNRMRIIRPMLAARDGEGSIRVVGWRTVPKWDTDQPFTAADISTMRAELDEAERLLAREAERAA